MVENVNTGDDGLESNSGAGIQKSLLASPRNVPDDALIHLQKRCKNQAGQVDVDAQHVPLLIR